MTAKEAIQIIKVAISEVEWDYPIDYSRAFEMAIGALSTQAESEKNEPMTLKELRNKDGKPVWVVLDGGGVVTVKGYGIVDVELECVYGLSFDFRFEDYGVWLAYNRKPEE